MVRTWEQVDEMLVEMLDVMQELVGEDLGAGWREPGRWFVRTWDLFNEMLGSARNWELIGEDLVTGR